MHQERGDLQLLGASGFDKPEFEKPLPIFRGGQAPNLDIWIRSRDRVIATESKLLEYLSPTLPRFSPSYDRLAPPWSESGWWAAYTTARNEGLRHLDRAQLVKHYFGLKTWQENQPHPPPPITLLYLFWTPLNESDLPECCRHREEIEAFARTVAGDSIAFRWMTYSELWTEWFRVPALREHASHLKARYEVTV